jgi:regulator of sigma E protease
MLLTLIIAFLSLIALMVIHEFGHFIIAKKFGVRVEEFGIGYPPRLFGKKFGDTLYSVNAVPLGAFVRIYGEEGGLDDYRSFSKLAIWKRILIVLGGVIAFWVAAFFIFCALFAIGAKVPVTDSQQIDPSVVAVRVSMVEAGSPAAQAGLLPGDEITGIKSSVAGEKITTVSGFKNFIANHKGTPVTVQIVRGGVEQSFNIVPRAQVETGQGAVGVGLERMATLVQQSPWWRVPWDSLVFTGKVTWKSIEGIAGFFASIFGGKGVPEGAELAGPVGITIFLANAASYGPGFFLYFIGSISVLVAIFNLFPIPALDGGKFVFLIIEKILRRPVSVKWEQRLTATFFCLLIAMSLFVTIRFDIPRVMEFWKTSL